MFSKKSVLTAAAAIVLAGFGSTSAHARGQATGTVESLTASAGVTNVFLSERIQPVNGETIPACSTRDQNFALAPEQRNQLAILLTAMALGSEVRITGADRCETRDGTEDVGSIRVLGQ